MAIGNNTAVNLEAFIHPKLSGYYTPPPKTEGAETTLNSLINEESNKYTQILIAEMRNQDPTEPMKTHEVAQTMVGLFNNYTMEKNNGLLKDLTAKYGEIHKQQAIGDIGKSVEWAGNTFTLDGNHTQEISYSSPTHFEAVTLNIINSNGGLVRSISVDGSKGFHKLKWDGKDQNGNLVPINEEYHVNVIAKDNKENLFSLPTMLKGRINDVDLTIGDDVYYFVGDTPLKFKDFLRVSKYQKHHEHLEKQDMARDDNNVPPIEVQA